MHVYIVIASAQNCVDYYPQVASQNGNATFGLVLINFDSLLFFFRLYRMGRSSREAQEHLVRTREGCVRDAF